MIGIYEYMTRMGFGRMKRAPQYLQQIRSRPCLICGSTQAVEAHHEGPHGLGKKTPDWLAVPLCRRCHADRHHGRVPDTYTTVVYAAQVQYLSREIELKTPFLKGAEESVVCGGCGGAADMRLAGAGVMPVCRECAKELHIRPQHFAKPWGLTTYAPVSEDVAYFRQLHVLHLAACASAKGRRE